MAWQQPIKKPYSLTPPHPQVVSIQPAPTGRALESESVYPTNGSNMGINMGINKKRPERRLFVDKLAERVGFEPTVRENRTPDFESGTFDHSATSPTQVRNVSRKPWLRYTAKKLIK